MNHKGVKLDEDSLLVLDSLARQDDYRLNTSEAKTITGIDDNDIVRLRFQKLEESGLVTLDKDESAPAPIPPYRATLTDEGQDKAETWDLDPKSSDIRRPEERLERVERRLDDIDERLRELEEDATANSDRVPEIRETRRVAATVYDYMIEDVEADLGKYYPTDEELNN